jgi:hypothetical protein
MFYTKTRAFIKFTHISVVAYCFMVCTSASVPIVVKISISVGWLHEQSLHLTDQATFLSRTPAGLALFVNMVLYLSNLWL